MPTPLHLEIVDTMARRSTGRDPDGFMSGIYSDSPDPVGLWLVRQMTRVADAGDAIVTAFRARRHARGADQMRADAA